MLKSRGNLRRFHVGGVALAVALAASGAGAVADGTFEPVALGAGQSRLSVFGGAVAVANSLMAFDPASQQNTELLLGGSEAPVPLARMAPDATVRRAILYWGGTISGSMDRTVDFRLPDGTLFNDLSVDAVQPGEPSTTLNGCKQRNHRLGDGLNQTQLMMVCRREVTGLLQALGPGGAVGSYGVEDVALAAGVREAWGGWALVIVWESPTESVHRDVLLHDGLYALDEQSGAAGFSSGIGERFSIQGFTADNAAAGELTLLAFAGDPHLGIPPQSGPVANRCNDRRCEDFASVSSDLSPLPVRLADANNPRGNLFNGSDNTSGGVHPGLDLDVFDLGASGLGVLRPDARRLFFQAGSGDGAIDDGSGGSGELFFLGFALVAVESPSPRFLNAGTAKEVQQDVAGPGEPLDYTLRIHNDGSQAATNTLLRDVLPTGVSYVPGSTTNTCGVSSTDVDGTSPLLQGGGLAIGTVAAGGRCEVRFRALVDDGVADGTVLENFFTVAADGLSALLLGPATTVVQGAQLGQPTKAVRVPQEPAPGALLSYTVRIPNEGPRSVTGVTLVDALPAELENLQVLSIPTGATNASSATTLELRNITIPAGSVVETVFSARIRANVATGSSIANQALVDQASLGSPLRTDDPNTPAPADPTIVVVAGGVSLAGSAKSVVDVNGGLLEPGDVLEFTIHVNKTGETPSSVTFADNLPLHVTACSVVATPPAGFAFCSPGGANGTGVVQGGVAFSPSGAADFQFRVTVAGSAPDGFSLENNVALVPSAAPAFATTVSSLPLVVVARPDFTASTKTVVDTNGGEARPGDLLSWSVRVDNSGQVPATDVVVRDVLPAGLVDILPRDGGVVAGDAVSWRIASIAAGTSATVRFEARIAANAANGDVISNTAAITAASPAAAFTTPPASIAVTASPLLAGTKVVADLTAAPFRPGDVVRYTIVVENRGDGAATGVVVRDSLDPSLEGAVPGSGGRSEGNEIVFDASTTSALARIEPGASVRVAFDARLRSSLGNGTAVQNQALITADGIGSPVLTDDPATPTPTDATAFSVTSQARLALAKTFVDENGGALLPGENVTFTLRMENTGDASATNVLVADPLDPRLTFVSSNTGGAFTNGVVTFPPITVEPGTPRTLSFTARTAAPLADGTTIDNQATASAAEVVGVVSDDPTTPTALDATRLVVVSRPILDTFSMAVVDVDGDSRFEPGDAVRYVLVVANSGDQTANDVVVTDALPSLLTNIVVGQGGVVTGGSVTWSIGTLPAGASQTLTVDGALPRPSANGIVVDNQAFVSAAGIAPLSSDDPATAARDDVTRFTVSSMPRLIVQKTVADLNSLPAEPNDELEYTITLQSVGGRDALGVTVTDALDASLTGAVPLDGGVLAGQRITWTIASLPLDTSTTLRFRARIKTPLTNGTVISNQARVAVGEANVPGAPFLSDDPSTATANDPTRIRVVSAANIAITTLESVGANGAPLETARPADTVRYRIIVGNAGNAPAVGVTVTLPLPADVNFVQAAGGVLQAGVVTFRAPTVAALARVLPGDVVTLEVETTLKTPLDNGSVVQAQARIAAGGSTAPAVSDDPSTAALGDPTTFSIAAAPDLASFDKEFLDESGGVVEPGEIVTWRLVLQNTGNAVARDVSITDELPATVELVDGAGGILSGRTLRYAIDSVAPGTPVEKRIRVRIPTTTSDATRIENQASVIANGVSRVLSDDPATSTADDPTVFAVVAQPRVRLEKTVVGTRDVAAGDEVTYSIVLSSEGTSSVVAAELVDELSAELTDVVPGAGLSFDPATRTLRGTLSSLPPGTSTSFEFTARVRTSASDGTLIPNQAVVIAPVLGEVRSDDPVTAAPDDATVLVVDARPSLAQTTMSATDLNGSPLLPGDLVRWDIRVDNTGTGAAQEVTVTDVLPAGLTITEVQNDGEAAGNTIAWQVPSIERGTSVSLAVVTRLGNGLRDGAVVLNQARLVAANLEGEVLSDDPSTAAAGDATAVTVRTPTLVLQKRFLDENGGDLEPGDPVVYTIDVRNGGSIAATNVLVTDNVPRALRDVVPEGGTFTSSKASWAAPALASGDAISFRLRARVDPATSAGTVIANAAEVLSNETRRAVRSDDPDTPAPNDDTIRVVNAIEQLNGRLELLDGETGEPLLGRVVPRQRVRARITIANGGNQVARNLEVRVPFDVQRVAFDETTENGLIDANDVRWNANRSPRLRQLSPGQELILELEGSVASPIPNDVLIEVEALVTSETTSSPVVIGPAGVRTRSEPLLGATTLEVIDEDGGFAEPGDVLTWRTTVLNDGGVVARDVVVLQAIPGGTTYLPGTTRLRDVPVDDVEGGAPTQLGMALGDVGPGRSVVLQLQVRVAPSAPRGMRLDSQAIVRARDVPDELSDNPVTPLIAGDPTSIVVGGAASLVAHKIATPASARVGERVRFEIHVENVGNEPAEELELSDPVPAGTRVVPGSIVVDGRTATDAFDRDEAEFDGTTLRVRRERLEAGAGAIISFAVVLESGSFISNQATVRATNTGATLTDADPTTPGAQATIVAVQGQRALLFDDHTLAITDKDGGALDPGDVVTARVRLLNRSLEAARVERIEIGLGENSSVVGDSVVDARLQLGGAGRSVLLPEEAGVVLEPGAAFDIAFDALVSEDARVGDVVAVQARAAAASVDGILRREVNLGTASLTVGLLPGTGVLEGTLFVDGGEHDGAFDAARDVPLRGLTVLAFSGASTTPVQTAIADGRGGYRLGSLPAGPYRLELRSPSGASFGKLDDGQLVAGSVVKRDLAVRVTGAVYVSTTSRPAEGTRVFLFVDDGNNDPNDDVLLDERELPDGQQGQVVSAQGLYRFDPPPGRYRIEAKPADPLLSFPSTTRPVTPDSGGNPSGTLAEPDVDGDVVELPLPREGEAPPYFLRFEVASDAAPLQRNFIPLDTLQSQVSVTKTANRKRASIGDIISYSVRVENKALSGVDQQAGGVEIADSLPSGFNLVAGSYRLERIERDSRGQERRRAIAVKDRGGRLRTFGPFDLAPQSTLELRYNVVVGPGTARGEQTNRASLRLARGQVPVGEEALATVQIVADGLFDLGTVRAKVFCDDDGDGWQGPSEAGLPAVRLFIDTGQWSDTDAFGKAHFSAIPAGMHLVKLDARTIPPGTVLPSPSLVEEDGGIRRVFYMSPGMPAQVSFPARCSFAVAGAPELVVNEDAYRPPPRRWKVEARASPSRLVLDGKEQPLPKVDLGVGVKGEEPTFAEAPGPNLLPLDDGRLEPRLLFVPRVEGTPTAWTIQIDSLGVPAASVEAIAADPGAIATPVWSFGGLGSPPPELVFDGRGLNGGQQVLVAGQLYRATLSASFQDGTTAMAAPRLFGIRAGGTSEIMWSEEAIGVVDYASMDLFTEAGQPTDRLLFWLVEHASALAERKVIVVVRRGREEPDNPAQDAERLAGLEAALVAIGVDAERIEGRSLRMPDEDVSASAAGPRVELLVEQGSVRLAPLAPPMLNAAAVKVNNQTGAQNDTFTGELELPVEQSLFVELTAGDGTRFRVERGSAVAASTGASSAARTSPPPSGSNVVDTPPTPPSPSPKGTAETTPPASAAPAQNGVGPAEPAATRPVTKQSLLVRLEDPFDAVGAIKPAARESLEQVLEQARSARAVRVEVHDDNVGHPDVVAGETQRRAELIRALLVASGVRAETISAVGLGGSAPLVPNLGEIARAKNRRAEIYGETIVSGPMLLANGVRSDVWQGKPFDLASAHPEVAGLLPPDPSRPPEQPVATRPRWWPNESDLPSSKLSVELPSAGADGVLRLHSDRLLVRGTTSPDNQLRIGQEEVAVDAETGKFSAVVKLPEGASELVVEVRDGKQNVGRVTRPVEVDTSGWFVMALADTAFGGGGTELGELSPTASAQAGSRFLYGRAAGFVKGRWRGPWLFQDYDLTLHLDTSRWRDDLFAPELIDPERFLPVYGDSAVENTDAMRSAFPVYLDLRADTSSVAVGNVRTELSSGDLFRYQRARSGAQLVFDRGWTQPLDVPAVDGTPKPPPSPVGDPWRTQMTGFVVGGGGQRHARVELLGTGSSVYFLRHERVVEGSERVSVIVRDGVTGTEIARSPMTRDRDYTVRYAEGRVFFKEPVGAFVDAGFIVNHNLGQVASGNRVFVEVEYEHQDDNPLMGVAAGADVKQALFGVVEVGGGYVYEGREGGQLGYQLGGAHVRLALHEGTWLQAELLGSQSVDAGNFVSLDGGLTYSALGQTLDQKARSIGQQRYPSERSGAAFKLGAQAELGSWVGRKAASDAMVHAYIQQLQPGFFAGAAIVEQGQTKWGTDGAWKIMDEGTLKLRYDGVFSEIPELQPLTEFRTLHREIATLRYEHRLMDPLLLLGEYGYGYTGDSGAFGTSTFAQPRDVHTNVTAMGVEWKALERLTLAVKQEAILTGDPNLLRGPLDHFVSHVQLKVGITEELELLGGGSLRWSGENQANAGVSWAVNEHSRVYVTERAGLLPAPGTGTMGFRTTTILGGESEVAEGSTAYAEYQLDGGFAGEQSRGVVGLKNQWKLPYGFALQLGYERILVVGGFVPLTQSGTVPPAAFTDGTFYAAPGANGAGSFLSGEGSRDALSAGIETKQGETVVASQRLELRYDDQPEARGGHDRLWFLSATGAAVRLSPELSLLARYNVALAQDLALAQREAWFEEGAFGVAYRPITHDWVSVLSKVSRRVDVRPLSLAAGVTDDYTAHAATVEPILELPFHVQIVEKLALKHAIQKLDDVPEAQALTALWINRLNVHVLGFLRAADVAVPLQADVDLGIEYRVLAGLTYASAEHGPLVELQLAPFSYFRIGLGYSWTRFSDDELERPDLDRSGFFIRGVGTF